MGMMGRMEKERREIGKEGNKRREKGLKSTEERGRQQLRRRWVHGDGCAGGREGRNAFLILKKK